MGISDNTPIGVKRSRSLVFGFLATLVGVVFFVAGCNRSDADIAPVEGIVRLDGKPLSRGVVRFTPQAGRSASGQIASNGTFVLGTYSPNDGARIGKHRVTIFAAKEEPKKDRLITYDETASSPENASLIPLHYGSAEFSGLEFDVEPGKSNHAEFDLTSTE